MSQSHPDPASTGIADFAHGNPAQSSPLSHSGTQHTAGSIREDFESARRGSFSVNDESSIKRSASTASTAVPVADSAPSRNNTLKKKGSVRKQTSLKRSGSRKSLKAGSTAGDRGRDILGDDFNSVFHTPIPTHGSPTEILANRFQAWRTLLKQLITYFREVQSSYDHRSKTLLKVSNVIGNLSHPSVFITDGGLADATRILQNYHKHSVTEANKSRDIEQDVISALSGLRSDLSQKIKEIKSLSGDFKNSVDKEKEGTRKAVEALKDALASVDHESAERVRNDPYVVKLGVDRMVEKQIDEENYLHRAYLNLENSGRELESIVVGEIQKSYNALAGILKREADDAYNAVESLKSGPIGIPKDMEWNSFVEHDPQFVNPRLPLRRIEEIEYPGKHHPAVTEVRAGMLERKSKYLKSYTPGWYVLSPTHLHEFKSADKIYSQSPVMSLYLPEQKLGSKSEPNSSSHKFMLKGKQAGSMHRGHSWVFRAESYDTMLAWFNDIKALTEKTGEERNAFVRSHARSISGNSHKPQSVSSDGMEEDEADQVPYSANASRVNQSLEQPQQRPQPARNQALTVIPTPGGRFPSDLQIPRHNRPISPSSGSSEPEYDAIAAATAMPGSSQHEYSTGEKQEEKPHGLEGAAAGAAGVAGYGAYKADKNEGSRAGPTEEDPVNKTVGGHQKSRANMPDARVQPEPDNVRGQTTAGPHRSDMPDKADLRGDSDANVAAPVPYNQQQPASHQQQPYAYQQQPSSYQQQPPSHQQQPAQYQQQPTQYQQQTSPHQQPSAGQEQRSSHQQDSHSDQNRQPDYSQHDGPSGGPVQTQTFALPIQDPKQTSMSQSQPSQQQDPSFLDHSSGPRHSTPYGDWMTPAAAAGAVGIGAGAAGTDAYRRHEQEQQRPPPQVAEKQRDNEQDRETGDVPALPRKSERRRSSPVTPTASTSALALGGGVPFPGRTFPPPPPVAPAAGSGGQPFPSAARGSMDAGAFDANRVGAEVAPGLVGGGRWSGSEGMAPMEGSSGVGSSAYGVGVGAGVGSNAAGVGSSGVGVGGVGGSGGSSSSHIGGLEAEGAHQTGRLFPRVLRHDTDMSVSRLHVPGEYPRGEDRG
ncbi:phosphatidylinositol 4,5-bisphosphate-binding protein [Elasticomyces elasticus]|nr:phosphatidylinositol 4,5-bisphosphate-binding protein [Elasticomyces elasticus]